ncbi:MAG: 1-deoxy-D-xylulose-5-phosphate reductoisomerase [Ignavibacteria bacterium]|nr:1-deoxy-D-xylulose-5-phosphate reductoisomerase [Ignavibacteria bacterium]
MVKKVSILGSTGSIGCNALDVIDSLNHNEYNIKVICLSTNSRISLLAEQIKKHSPETVVIGDKKAYEEFKSNFSFPETEILFGNDALSEISGRDNYELLISALVGFSGLRPTVNAIKSGKDVALANKETLVVAGKLINQLIEKYKVKLIPIDSEHSAILQCLAGENISSVSKIILTASGGPFRNKTLKQMKDITVEEALSHPNWKMGKKITIDSATMMNKGLEVIEAKWLFKTETEKIDVLIHPQSVIHSMVEFIDGSIKAQLGIPDMKIPIQYAITYPDRINSVHSKMDFNLFNSLTFENVDTDKFRCLRIAYDVIKEDSSSAVVMNAANEIAVDLFLNGRIDFLSIPDIIERELDRHKPSPDTDLENIINVDKDTRIYLREKYSI